MEPGSCRAFFWATHGVRPPSLADAGILLECTVAVAMWVVQVRPVALLAVEIQGFPVVDLGGDGILGSDLHATDGILDQLAHG